MPRALRSIFFLALALTATTAARADLVTSLSATVTHEANGLYRYDYILSVGAKSTAGASNFNMTVDPAAALIFGAASAPSGWDVSYMAGDPAVMFSSPDPTLDIAPGATGKFEFESRLGPLVVPYQTAGFDGSGSFLTSSGTIVSAAAVPASALLLGIGGLGLTVTTRRLRSARRPL